MLLAENRIPLFLSMLSKRAGRAEMVAPKLRIASVCLGPLKHDSRVLRIAGALQAAGHDTRIFGFAPLPENPVAQVTAVADAPGPWRARLGMGLRQAPAQIIPATAPLLYWASSARVKAARLLAAFKPDVVIANDWRALPLAARAKQMSGARILYDSHEFAAEEFAESRAWRLLARRHAIEIERRGIARADFVMTVSGAIARSMHSTYGLARLPLVLRNIPDQPAAPFRAASEPLKLLYLGSIVPRRGLENIAESLPLWNNGGTLTLIGQGSDTFIAGLRQRAGAAADRMTILPPVAPERIVEAAQSFDIGIIPLPGTSSQLQAALPNKLFEYIRSGLAVLSTPLPEIAAVLKAHGCGALLPSLEPADIAAAVNGLEPAAVNHLKRNSVKAAESLTFNAEIAPVLDWISDTKAPQF